jgi:hypothetical protein
MLPILLDAGADGPNIPLGQVIGVVSVLLNVIGFLVLRGYANDRKADRERIDTAIAQADKGLAGLAVERERVTELKGELKLANEKIDNLKRIADDSLPRDVYVAETRAQTAELARAISQREMRAANAPIRREDGPSEPPPSGHQLPPMRGRLPSRR